MKLLEIKMVFLLTIWCTLGCTSKAQTSQLEDRTMKNKAEIYLAGGCFWGVQHYFDHFDRNKKTKNEYTNGKTQNPEYKDVKAGLTGHADTLFFLFVFISISLSKI